MLPNFLLIEELVKGTETVQVNKSGKAQFINGAFNFPGADATVDRHRLGQGEVCLDYANNRRLEKVTETI